MRSTSGSLVLLVAVVGGGCAKGIDSPAETPRVQIATSGKVFKGLGSRTACNANMCDGDHLLHDVVLSYDFSIEAKEVSAVQYAFCVAEEKCDKPRGGRHNLDSLKKNRPALVTRQQAEEYCRVRGGRLPTEAEWEIAARTDGDNKVMPFPWGEDSPCNHIKASDCPGGGGEAVDVGTNKSDVTPRGISDMGGNASEWVLDNYTATPNCESETPYYRICDQTCIGVGAGRCKLDGGRCEIDCADGIEIGGELGFCARSLTPFIDPFHFGSTPSQSGRLIANLLKGGSGEVPGCRADPGHRHRVVDGELKAGFRCVYSPAVGVGEGNGQRGVAEALQSLTERLRLPPIKECTAVTLSAEQPVPPWWSRTDYQGKPRVTVSLESELGSRPLTFDGNAFKLADPCVSMAAPKSPVIVVRGLPPKSTALRVNLAAEDPAQNCSLFSLDLTEGESANATVRARMGCL